jgi:hypothetical protein
MKCSPLECVISELSVEREYKYMRYQIFRILKRSESS